MVLGLEKRNQARGLSAGASGGEQAFSAGDTWTNGRLYFTPTKTLKEDRKWRYKAKRGANKKIPSIKLGRGGSTLAGEARII